MTDNFNAIGQPGASSPDCGCSGTCNGGLYDYSAHSDLTDINIVSDSDGTKIDSPSTTMSGGVLTVASGEVAYPTFGRDWCKGYQILKPDESVLCGNDATWLDSGGLDIGTLRFRANLAAGPVKMRFGQIYKLPSGSPVWPSQRIVQTGSATSGTWTEYLTLCGAFGSNVYNATASDVANHVGILGAGSTNLYADVTLLPFTATISSGSAPNATYDVTFNGVSGWACGLPGQLPTLTIGNSTDTGSFAVSVLEAGPTLEINSYWELYLATSGSYLKYVGPDANPSGSGSGVTLTLGYPYDSPCSQTISAALHDIAISASFVLADGGSSDDSFFGMYFDANPKPLLTITLDGNQKPLFRVPYVKVPSTIGAPSDSTTFNEAGDRFLWHSEGYISSPAFYPGSVVENVKWDCYGCPVTISCGCQSSENSSSKQYLSVTGVDLSSLVSALPDSAFYNTDTSATDTAFRTVLASVASGTVVLKRTTFCDCTQQDPTGTALITPITYDKQCIGKFSITPLTGDGSNPYSDPVVVDHISSGDYPNGFILNAELIATAVRVYDYWALLVRGSVYYRNQSSSQQYQARTGTMVFAIFVSCPGAVGGVSAARASLPVPGTFVPGFPVFGPLLRYLFPWHGPYDYIGNQKLDSKGWWQNESGYIGQTNSNGDQQVGAHTLDDITITPTDTAPDNCKNRKASYKRCGDDSDAVEIVQTNAGPTTVTLKSDGSCADFVEWVDDDTPTTDSITGTFETCEKCNGCGCCEGKIAFINFAITSGFSIYKKSSFGAGNLLCQTLTGLGGNTDSDGYAEVGTFSFCNATTALSGFTFSPPPISPLCNDSVALWRSLWSMEDCKFNLTLYLIDGGGRVVGQLYFTATSTTDDCFDGDGYAMTCLGGYLTNGCVIGTTTDMSGNPVFDTSLVVSKVILHGV